MQLLGIIQKIRNDGWLPQDPKTKFKELRQTIDELKLPFVGRILTAKKYYGGRIEKLEFGNGPQNGGRLKFVITDCDRNGQSQKTAKTYQRTVAFNDLIDVQTC